MTSEGLEASGSTSALASGAAQDGMAPGQSLAEALSHALTEAPLRVSPALETTLAQHWAAGKFLDPQTACTGLRGAVQAAAEIARLAQGDGPEAALLRPVAGMNDQGDPEAAGAMLEAALATAPEALHAAALLQDRLRNRPELAAQRHVAALKASAPAGGVFRATVSLIYERLEAGEHAGDPFEMTLALELAKLAYKRAKGGELGQAQTCLGNCHQVIGQFRPGRKHLDLAAELFAAAAKAVARTKHPENWAYAQHNLGGILELIGLRQRDAAMLRKAAAAYRGVLEVFRPETAPLDCANTTANLAHVRAVLGRMAADPVAISEAIEVLEDALEGLPAADHPEQWAAAAANLGIARRYLGEATGEAAVLLLALEDLTAAEAALAAPAQKARVRHALGLTCLALDAALPGGDWLGRAAAEFAAALALGQRDSADFRWAESLTGLGRVALARARKGEAGQMAVAREALRKARGVLALDPTGATLADCDTLLAEAEAG